MIFSKHEARQHRELAETWRTDTMSALASTAVQEALKPEFSLRLSKYVEHVGILALKSSGTRVDKKYSKPAQNGIYIAPTPRRLFGSMVRIPYENSEQRWMLPGLGGPDSSAGAQHSCLDSLPGVHLITMPTEQNAQLPEEHVALLLHEFTHVDQVKRGANWKDCFDEESNTIVANEAEAYNVQFKVLDSYLGGALERVCKATLDSGVVVGSDEDKVIVVPVDIELPGGRSRLTTVESWTVIYEAYNRVTGYIPGRTDMAPRELINIYEQHGYIIPEFQG